MALKRAEATSAPKKVVQVRKLVQSESHLVQSAITRKDESGNLFEAVADLTKGTITIQQTTRPFTAKSVEDVEDVIEFFQEQVDLIRNAPAPSVEDPNAAKSAPATVAKTTVSKRK